MSDQTRPPEVLDVQVVVSPEAAAQAMRDDQGVCIAIWGWQHGAVLELALHSNAPGVTEADHADLADPTMAVLRYVVQALAGGASTIAEAYAQAHTR